MGAAAQVWEMHALLAEGIRTGEVAPLPWTVFARSKMQDAFRYLASGAHQSLAGACGALHVVQQHVSQLSLHSSGCLTVDKMCSRTAKHCCWHAPADQ